MTQLVMWMVAAYGMTTILVYGSIFNGLRNWIHKNANPNIGWILFRPIFAFISSLIQCMLCTGTWVGFFMSFTTFSPWHELIGFDRNFSIFFDGMLSAGAVWAINGVIEWFEENRPSNKN
jgi:hypothetical protein